MKFHFELGPFMIVELYDGRKGDIIHKYDENNFEVEFHDSNHDSQLVNIDQIKAVIFKDISAE